MTFVEGVARNLLRGQTRGMKNGTPTGPWQKLTYVTGGMHPCPPLATPLAPKSQKTPQRLW